MHRVKNIKLVRECGLHHLSIEDRDIWLDTQEVIELYRQLGHVKL